MTFFEEGGFFFFFPTTISVSLSFENLCVIYIHVLLALVIRWFI